MAAGTTIKRVNQFGQNISILVFCFGTFNLSPFCHHFYFTEVRNKSINVDK